METAEYLKLKVMFDLFLKRNAFLQCCNLQNVLECMKNYLLRLLNI